MAVSETLGEAPLLRAPLAFGLNCILNGHRLIPIDERVRFEDVVVWLGPRPYAVLG